MKDATPPPAPPPSAVVTVTNRATGAVVRATIGREQAVAFGTAVGRMLRRGDEDATEVFVIVERARVEGPR